MSKRMQKIADQLERDFNEATGEVMPAEDLNRVVVIESRRPNGTLRIQRNFDFCPSMAEQHSAQMTDLNFLIAKFKPDELAQYIAARSQGRSPIGEFVDLTNEPSLQDAKNVVYRARQAFLELPDEIKLQFRSPVEFYKHLDNPANQEKLIKLGLMKRKEIEEIRENLGETGAVATPPTTTT